MKRRNFLSQSAAALAGVSILGRELCSQPSEASHGAGARPAGTYEPEIPDTLDLVDRANISLHVLTEVYDPAFDYEMFERVDYSKNPPVMSKDAGGMLTIQPKFLESLAMMRIMTGSKYNAEIDGRIMDAMLRRLGPDGLYYEIYKPETVSWTKTDEDYTNMYADARMVLAMLAWYRYEGDPKLLQHIQKMVEGIDRIALRKDDYIYYPPVEIAKVDCYHYSRLHGWKFTTEADPTRDSYQHDYGMLMLCGQARALTEVYRTTGNDQALELAHKMINNVTRPVVWQACNKGQQKGIITPENLAVGYAIHAHTAAAALRGILNYAMVSNDYTLLEFARNAYEYARSTGIERLGWFGSYTPPYDTPSPRRPPYKPPDHYSNIEPCMTADMVALAIRLSDAGAGDYWDDVDSYVRNELIELQYCRPDLMEKVSLAGRNITADAPRQSTDRVLERTLGSFAIGIDTGLTGITGEAEHCCTGNCTQALYYAWESIVRYENGAARINLLLNRASPWLDVQSYLPYEGKVIIQNKSAYRLSVRIPRWVNRKAINSELNGRPMKTSWFGNFLCLDSIAPGDKFTIRFPVTKETVKLSWFGKEYSAEFKGNTLVNISPRDEGLHYPIYLRDHLKQERASMKKVMPYVSPKVIDW